MDAQVLRFVALAAIAAAPFAHAQGVTGEAEGGAASGDLAPAAQADPGKPRWRIALDQHWSFPSDLRDGAEGDVSVSRTALGIAADFDAADDLAITIGFREELSIYDFDDASLGVASIPGSALDGLDTFWHGGLAASARYRLDGRAEGWSLLGAATVRSSMAQGADFGDSITGGGAIGAGYQFGDDLFLGLGGGVMSRLEDGAAFFPLVQLHWRVNDRATLGTNISALPGGFGLELAVKATDDITFRMFGGYESRAYRLDDDAAGLAEGVMRDAQAPIGLGITWAPSRHIELALDGGAVVWREFEFLDDSGHEVTDTETDPALFLGGRLTFRF